MVLKGLTSTNINPHQYRSSHTHSYRYNNNHRRTQHTRQDSMEMRRRVQCSGQGSRTDQQCVSRVRAAEMSGQNTTG